MDDCNIQKVVSPRNIFVTVRKFVIQSLILGTRRILVGKYVGRLWKDVITNVFCSVIRARVQLVLKLSRSNVTVARVKPVSRDVTTLSGHVVLPVAGN